MHLRLGVIPVLCLAPNTAETIWILSHDGRMNNLGEMGCEGGLMHEQPQGHLSRCLAATFTDRAPSARTVHTSAVTCLQLVVSTLRL